MLKILGDCVGMTGDSLKKRRYLRFTFLGFAFLSFAFRICHIKYLLVKVRCEGVPVLEADFEDFHIIHIRDENKILEGICKLIFHSLFLQKDAVFLEKCTEEESQVLNKLLISVRCSGVHFTDVNR